MSVWMYGANGEAKVFEKAEDAPAGWSDTFATFGGVAVKRDGAGGTQSIVIEGCKMVEPAKRGPGRPPKTPDAGE